MVKKPFFLLLISLTAALCGHAQLKKGNRMIGFSIASAFFNNASIERSNNLTSSTIENDNFGISINPSIGWFISDNIALGVSPVISFSKQKQVGNGANGNTFLKDELNQYSFALGGFARYYFKGESTFRFFGQYNLSAGITGGKNEGYEYESIGTYVDRYDNKFSGGIAINTGVNFGASKFLNNHIALDIYLGYNFSYSKTNPKGTALRDYSDPSTPDQTQNINYDQKITGHNFQLGAGLQVFLDRKKK